MRNISTAIALAIALTAAPGAFANEIETTKLEYKDGDLTCVGYVAKPKDAEGKLPVVIVVHEWWGLTEHPKMRARMLAEAGYIGFALDMYGDGKTTEDGGQAGQWAGIRGKPDESKRRFQAAMTAIAKHPNADMDRVAAIGFCFGGTIVLDMARLNLPLKGVASFHGGLGTKTAPIESRIAPKVLVLHGADDPFVSEEERLTFIKEMQNRATDWQMFQYGGAVHSFTNPDADGSFNPGAKYHEQTAKRSWAALERFLKETL